MKFFVKRSSLGDGTFTCEDMEQPHPDASPETVKGIYGKFKIWTMKIETLEQVMAMVEECSVVIETPSPYIEPKYPILEFYDGYRE